MTKVNVRYWLCQLLGWGLFGIIVLYFNLIVFSDRWAQGGKKEYLISLAIFLGCGVLITHLLRTIIKKINWLKFSFNKVVIIFIFSVLITSILFFYVDDMIGNYSPYSYDNYIKNKRLDKAKSIEQEVGLNEIEYYKNPVSKDNVVQQRVAEIKKATGWYRNKNGEWKYEDKTDLFGIYQNLLLISLWMLIYLVYHYVQKNRNDQLDRLKLENLVKELELKTIKSHINPHFIFNSLNSIRALVDENPERARTAITELSNILRSSMKAENTETVPLAKELDIVKDYLALEQMRFEERLMIEIDVDEDTLQQQVPFMMLQTLVENAIKHGISKQVDGGIVRIIIGFKNNKLELLIQNTGQLSETINKDGFGIKSTQDRLNLMYPGKAAFEIHSIEDNMVESKVIMPII